MKRDLERAGALLKDTLLEAEGLAGSCEEAGWSWKPAPGVWSAAACLAHLNQTNREYVASIRRIVIGGSPMLSDAPLFRYGLLERWFVKSMGPPVKVRLKAPKVFAPQSENSRDETMAEWRRIHLELMSLIEESARLDLRKNRVISPVSRHFQISLGMVFPLIAAHNRRHLFQARRTLEYAASSLAGSRS
ncbi:MAG: DinB family protein [Bryobacteraceae bacterium]